MMLSNLQLQDENRRLRSSVGTLQRRLQQQTPAVPHAARASPDTACGPHTTGSASAFQQRARSSACAPRQTACGGAQRNGVAAQTAHLRSQPGLYQTAPAHHDAQRASEAPSRTWQNGYTAGQDAHVTATMKSPSTSSNRSSSAEMPPSLRASEALRSRDANAASAPARAHLAGKADATPRRSASVGVRNHVGSDAAQWQRGAHRVDLGASAALRAEAAAGAAQARQNATVATSDSERPLEQPLHRARNGTHDERRKATRLSCSDSWRAPKGAQSRHDSQLKGCTRQTARSRSSNPPRVTPGTASPSLLDSATAPVATAQSLPQQQGAAAPQLTSPHRRCVSDWGAQASHEPADPFLPHSAVQYPALVHSHSLPSPQKHQDQPRQGQREPSPALPSRPPSLPSLNPFLPHDQSAPPVTQLPAMYSLPTAPAQQPSATRVWGNDSASALPPQRQPSPHPQPSQHSMPQQGAHARAPSLSYMGDASSFMGGAHGGSSFMGGGCSSYAAGPSILAPMQLPWAAHGSFSHASHANNAAAALSAALPSATVSLPTDSMMRTQQAADASTLHLNSSSGSVSAQLAPGAGVVGPQGGAASAAAQAVASAAAQAKHARLQATSGMQPRYKGGGGVMRIGNPFAAANSGHGSGDLQSIDTCVEGSSAFSHDCVGAALPTVPECGAPGRHSVMQPPSVLRSNW